MKVSSLLRVAAGSLAVILPTALACESCEGRATHVEHVRQVKRMQPGAQPASYGPTRPLEWGQLNVLHTTDTHGWLEGHLTEQNYGADWGDFVSFAKHIKQKAANLGVDLLLIDTGDLHDGTGLSDATATDGQDSNKVFEGLDSYDLLTIGNHELYVSAVAYQDFNQFSKFWGDRYLTSNVQILNPKTNTWDYIGQTHRYFTTTHGLRVMAFGVLFDFTGNSNASMVIPAATMVTQEWFLSAINTKEPVDLFLLIGHNPARPTVDISTIGTVYDAIRKVHAHTPIQIFGGHTHIRDFAVLDQSSTSLESGRYCETLGWFSMSGFSKSNSGYHGVTNPRGVPNPTRKATNTSTAPFVYSRRYLDWNRLTFEFHTVGAQNAKAFDYHSGLEITAEITAFRNQLDLGKLIGCAPNSYCMTCVAFGDPLSIFTPLSDALGITVLNPNRTDKARMVFTNTGGIRFDLYKGPFTFDDNFIVSPFRDVWLYIPDVPYSIASTVLDGLNNGGASRRAIDFAPLPRDLCVNPLVWPLSDFEKREDDGRIARRVVTRRQVVTETPGYTTTDDFGTDGDDTIHTQIPFFSIPEYFMGQGGFPATGNPDVVDLIFVDFIESFVLPIIGSNYSAADVTPYVSENFTTQDYLIPYVQQKWQAGLPNCPM